MYKNQALAHDLFATLLSFNADGSIRLGERSFTTAYDGGWQAAAFHAETDADVHADHWEMHPEADEAVCCLSGGMRVYLRPADDDADSDNDGDGAEEMTLLPAGSAVVVPRGRWHRLELDAPSDLLSITPRRGTRLEQRC